MNWNKRRSAALAAAALLVGSCLAGQATQADARVAPAAAAAPECWITVNDPYGVAVGVVDAARMKSFITCSGSPRDVRLQTVLTYKNLTGNWQRYGANSDRTESYGRLNGTRESWAQIPAVGCQYDGWASVSWTLPNGVRYGKTAFANAKNLCH